MSAANERGPVARTTGASSIHYQANASEAYSTQAADSKQVVVAFATPRLAALALLNDETQRLTRKAGSFLGQLCADPSPMSEKQADWLNTMLDRAGQPIMNGEAQS